jgi:NTP pyrophosphatase (non-canonical NTP hydrolase)
VTEERCVCTTVIPGDDRPLTSCPKCLGTGVGLPVQRPEDPAVKDGVFKTWDNETPTKKEPPVKTYEATLDLPFTFTRVVLSWNPPYLPKLVFYKDTSLQSNAAHVTLGPETPEDPRVLDLNELAALAYANSKEKGFYDPLPTFENRIALIHSEVSEAMEEFREGRSPTDVRYTGPRNAQVQKPEGIPSEFADIIIRILDASAYYGIDIDTAVREKMAYNKTREHKHGKKF